MLPSLHSSCCCCGCSISCKQRAENNLSTGLLVQGAPQRRQLAERIYAYEAALPEDLLQQGIGPPGNTNRLLKVFHKLMTGQDCIYGRSCLCLLWLSISDNFCECTNGRPTFWQPLSSINVRVSCRVAVLLPIFTLPANIACDVSVLTVQEFIVQQVCKH